ncbi:MAG TPA: hypothetical protein VMV56_09630 [Williamwhitmania sp.]|nr:hypothetical protein [Williamwhitmania sp.]
MADTILKSPGAIAIHGGGVLAVEIVTADGQTPTLPWVDIGTIATFSHKDDTTVKKEPDETGNIAAVNLDVRDVIETGTIMESNATLINFLKDSTRDVFFRAYKYLGIVNGKKQEAWFPLCKFVPKIDLTSGTKRIPFEIHFLPVSAATTFATAPASAYAAPPVIAAGSYYALTET